MLGSIAHGFVLETQVSPCRKICLHNGNYVHPTFYLIKRISTLVDGRSIVLENQRYLFLEGYKMENRSLEEKYKTKLLKQYELFVQGLHNEDLRKIARKTRKKIKKKGEHDLFVYMDTVPGSQIEGEDSDSISSCVSHQYSSSSSESEAEEKKVEKRDSSTQDEVIKLLEVSDKIKRYSRKRLGKKYNPDIFARKKKKNDR